MLLVADCAGPTYQDSSTAEPSAESIAVRATGGDVTEQSLTSQRRVRLELSAARRPGPVVQMAASPAAPSSSPAQAATDDAPLAQAPSAGALAPAPEPPAANPGTPAPDAARRPALIYDARLQLAVFEAARAIDAAEKLAAASGGYLVHRDDNAITFRVPSERFDTALADAAKLGDVLHREVSVRDVSDEVRDLELRLRNARATRERLEQLLARAEKVPETLEVARELERVTGEIEQLEGRLKVLDELIAFSTITLQFQAHSVDRVDSSARLPFPWLEHLGLGELLQL